MMTESGFEVLPHCRSLSLGLNRPILTSRTILSYTYLAVVYQERHLFWYAFFFIYEKKEYEFYSGSNSEYSLLFSFE